MTTPQEPDKASGEPDPATDAETTINPVPDAPSSDTSSPDWSSYEPTVVAGSGDGGVGGDGGPLPPQAYPGYPNPYAEQPSATQSDPSQADPTQLNPQQPPSTYPYTQPDPYAGQSYSGQPYAGQPYAGQPYASQPYAPQPYSYTPPPSPQSVFASQGPAPQTGQVSSIVALVVGGMLLLSCYGTLAGIAPTVLGILGVVQSNSVNRSWMAGQIEEARRAAEGSKKKAMWAWISMGIGVVVTIAVVIIIIALAVRADTTSTGYST